jgi:hypothetical protein
MRSRSEDGPFQGHARLQEIISFLSQLSIEIASASLWPAQECVKDPTEAAAPSLPSKSFEGPVRPRMAERRRMVPASASGVGHESTLVWKMVWVEYGVSFCYFCVRIAAWKNILGGHRKSHKGNIGLYTVFTSLLN